MKRSRSPKSISQAIIIGILLFQLFPQTVNKIDGFGGFKFGMTLDEAIQVRDDDIVNDNPTYFAAYKTIERATSIYGYDAVIVAQINDKSKLLDRVVVEFRRWEGGCEEVAGVIIEKLLDIYGGEYVKSENSKGTWTFPSGGTITMFNICYGDSGQVSVAYASTIGL